MSNKYVVVIGASNVDIGGTPYNKLIPEDSNPGRITVSSGGVGRNIANNLVNMGVRVRLITAVGNDILGNNLLDHCREEGIDTEHTIISDDYSSSMYLYINDEEGDMKLALSDMDVCSLITPEYIDDKLDIINGSSAVVADCNLSHETLMHLKKVCKVPIFVDTVSVNKADKIKNNLDGFFAVKPNILEAAYLTGMSVITEEDCIAASYNLIRQGAKNVFISMGHEGILATNHNNIYIVDHYNADVVSTTGAGDSSTAAIVWSYINGSDILTAAKAANAAAALTIESEKSINPDITAEKLHDMIKNDNVKVRKIKY